MVSNQSILTKIASQEPVSVADRICSLCEAQLYLLAALTYLHLRGGEKVRHFTVAQLVTEYDKMTSALRTKVKTRDLALLLL